MRCPELRHQGITATDYVAIVGMGRSGSTFVEARVAQSLQGVAVGELPGIWGAFSQLQSICSCGEPMLECGFWSRVREKSPGLRDRSTLAFMQRVNRKIMPIRRVYKWPLIGRSVQQHKKQPTWLRQYQSHVIELYSALITTAQEMGYEAVVDSSKHPLWYRISVSSGALEKFEHRAAVRVVRDPRAVAYSLARPRTEPTAEGERDIQLSYSLRQAIPYWLVMNLGADLVTRPDPIVVRYEDLAEEHYASELRNRGFHLTCVDEVPQAFSHQLIGNPSRRKAEAQKFRLDERWTNEARRPHERLCWWLLRPILRRYGYR